MNSMPQHAVANGYGQSEFWRPQFVTWFTTVSRRVATKPVRLRVEAVYSHRSAPFRMT